MMKHSKVDSGDGYTHTYINIFTMIDLYTYRSCRTLKPYLNKTISIEK